MITSYKAIHVDDSRGMPTSRRDFFTGLTALASLSMLPVPVVAAPGSGLISAELTLLMDAASFIQELFKIIRDINQNVNNIQQI
jgi:hypothetical protein